MGLWVRAYAFLIRYRFRRDLTPRLRLPYPVDLADIQRKATGSLTSTGVFFGLSVALMAAFLGDTGKELKQLVKCAVRIPGSWALLSFCTAISVVLPYLLIRAERSITAASVDRRYTKNKYTLLCRYIMLVLYLCSALFLYLLAPSIWPSTDMVLRGAFPLSGFALIIFSVYFLLFALEFYDSASSWRGKDAALHFHLASIAATSYLFGISFALIGASLLLCMSAFWVGRIATVATLIAVTAMSEIQRNLWNLRDTGTGRDESEQDSVAL